MASPSFQDLPPVALENRQRLIEIMNRFGFTVSDSERWHYDFNDWEFYSILDIPFSQISR